MFKTTKINTYKVRKTNKNRNKNKIEKGFKVVWQNTLLVPY